MESIKIIKPSVHTPFFIGLADDLSLKVQAAYQQAQLMQTYHKYGINRTRYGFYYISHYYPLRAMQPVSQQEIMTAFKSLETDYFETYIHFPFCEQRCTFCHFYKEIERGELAEKETNILDAIKKEIFLYRKLLGTKIKARSLQIGGGTPSLISNKELKKLLDFIYENYEFTADPELKIELYPKQYSELELNEKLTILRDYGFTDLAIDLESGNKKTLDFIARKNSSLEYYLALVDKCIAKGFDSIVTALMCGLPYETFTSLAHTLQELSIIDAVKVINTFPLISRPTDPISRQVQKHPDAYIDELSRDAMWIFARNFLRDKGFTEGPISYLHNPTKRPQQQSDKFECVNLIGFGTSAFGYLNGQGWASQYYNFCNQSDYFKRINNNEFPIWRMGKYGQEERARRKVIFGLANVKTENLVAVEKRFGISINKIYGKIFNALLDLGFIEIDKKNQGIYYTEKGLCRLEELMYFLSSKYVKDVCDKWPEIDDPHYQELINQHYFVTIAPHDRILFEKFTERFNSNFMQKIGAVDISS